MEAEARLFTNFQKLLEKSFSCKHIRGLYLSRVLYVIEADAVAAEQ